MKRRTQELEILPSKKQESIERILVWDDYSGTVELRRLLKENLPTGFDVENSNGSSDDFPVCTVNSGYGLLPVVCEDQRADDKDYWKPLAFAAPPQLSDYDVVL